MFSHIPNRPGEIMLQEMILAVKAISILSCVPKPGAGSDNNILRQVSSLAMSSSSESKKVYKEKSLLTLCFYIDSDFINIGCD